MRPRLHAEVTGQGPTAVIQGPAWGPSSDYLRLTLAPLLEGFRVLTYDPRNVGRSERVDAPEAQATHHLVDDLEQLREELGLEDLVLLGHSHGGVVAMGYAVRHPERLRGLVLLSTGVLEPGSSADSRRLVQQMAADPRRQEAVELFRKGGGRPEGRGQSEGIRTDAGLARWMRRLMPLYFYDLEAMQRFQRSLRNTPPPSVAALQRMPREVPEPWVVEGLAAAEVPTLILTGRYDVAAPPAAARDLLERIPHAELSVLDRSGHHPWVEEPEAFREALEEFLRRLP